MEKISTVSIGNHAPTEHDLQLATAALLVEMMLSDDQIHAAEQQKIKAAIKAKFQLSDAETQELMRLAEKQAKDATDFYQFTSIINTGFSAEQKVKVIEYLWQVAYVDDHLDPLEEHMVRKIADLLYVSHKDFIATKLKIKKKW
jgi:uncharacterized tellurite resistance protein B-like protein